MADIVFKGLGGINEDFDNATKDQCVAARNVWAPAGRVVQRPGNTGVGAYMRFAASLFAGRILTHDVSTGVITETNVVGGLEEGDYIYLLLEDVDVDEFRAGTGFRLSVDVPNTNAVGILLEYWNGTEWRWSPTSESISRGVKALNTVSYAFSDDGSGWPEHFFSFVWPYNWTPKDVVTSGGVTRIGYALRLTLINKGMAFPATLSAATEIGTFVGDTGVFITEPDRQRPMTGMFRFDLASGRAYAFVSSDQGTTSIKHVISVTSSRHGLALEHETAVSKEVTSFEFPPYDGSLSTLAPVPQADRAYLTMHGVIFELSPFIEAGNYGTPAKVIPAEVETSEAIVGPGAFADKETLAQLSDFPKGKIVVFFQNRLWICDKHRVRWSLAAPAHKVWPASAFADLMENDNSEIIAAAALGEHLVIYKQDSIWIMVLQSIDDFGVPQFTPVQVVRGIGCVAPKSLQTVRGRHVFLAEDGIYMFDGTPNVRKVTLQGPIDRLGTTVGQISPAMRYMAAGVNWQSKSCYLLSFASIIRNQQANTTTIVWQYDRDIWWVWDGFDGQFWMVDEGPHDDEELYFGDRYGRIYHFGSGQTDYTRGDLLPYIEYPYIGRDDGLRKIITDIELFGTNDSAPSTVYVQINDSTVADALAASYSLQHPAEAKYGSAIFGTSSYVGQRQRFLKRDWSVRGDFFKVSITKTGGSAGLPWTVASVRVAVNPLARR